MLVFKRYDRVLSASIHQIKHLNLVFQLKDKIFFRERGQFFTHSKGLYWGSKTNLLCELENLRRTEADEKIETFRESPLSKNALGINNV